MLPMKTDRDLSPDIFSLKFPRNEYNVTGKKSWEGQSTVLVCQGCSYRSSNLVVLMRSNIKGTGYAGRRFGWLHLSL